MKRKTLEDPRRRQRRPEVPLWWPVAAVAAALTVGACNSGWDKATEKFDDAPRGVTNDEPADILTNPDGFSNVAAKCDGTTRVYVLFHGDSPYGSVAVSPNHPSCGGSR